MLEEGKRRLVRRVNTDEEKDPREVLVEDLNVSRDRSVMLVADLAVELGERGWVPWEKILSVCWSWTDFLVFWGKVSFNLDNYFWIRRLDRNIGVNRYQTEL